MWRVVQSSKAMNNNNNNNNNNFCTCKEAIWSIELYNFYTIGLLYWGQLKK
jgi:hypothetical protein